MAPFCDICWRSDSSSTDRRMKMQRCCQCGVHFHNACYGRYGDAAFMELQDNLVCWACKSVGTTVKVRERDKETGKRLEFTIRERPTECCLCSVDDGERLPHAMHPVYDYHGPRGRQMVLPPSEGKPKRLAWAHSLCCSSICSHSQVSGCVYGCDIKGAYGAEDVDEDEDDELDDDESVNSDLQENDEAQESIHHFVYILPQEKRTSKDKHELRRRRKRSDPGADWLRKIRQHQNSLKCTICAKSDIPDPIRRIAVQCSANDPGEFKDFRGHHADLDRHEFCSQAVHIGCAIWGKEEGEYPNCRRLYYFPGLDDSEDYSPTIVNVYCTLHAENLLRHRIKGAMTLRYPANRKSRKIPASTQETRLATHHTQVKIRNSSATLARADKRMSAPSVASKGLKSVAAPSVVTVSSALEKRIRTEELTRGLAARKKVRRANASLTTAGVSSPKGMKKVMTHSAASAAPKPPPYERNSSALLKHAATVKKKISRGKDLLTTKVAKRPAAATGRQHPKVHPHEKESSLSMERQLKLPPHERQTGLGTEARRGSGTKHLPTSHGAKIGGDNSKKAAGDSAVEDHMLRDVLRALLLVQNGEKQEILAKLRGREKHWRRKSNLSSAAFKEAWKRLEASVWETLQIPAHKPKHTIKHRSGTGGAAVARKRDISESALMEEAKKMAVAESREKPHEENDLGLQPNGGEDDDEDEFLFDSAEDMSAAKPTGTETEPVQSAREMMTQETADDSSKVKSASATAVSSVSSAPETNSSERKGKDWSFLLVGKNYDRSRLDMETWDTVEDLPLVRDK